MCISLVYSVEAFNNVTIKAYLIGATLSIMGSLSIIRLVST